MSSVELLMYALIFIVFALGVVIGAVGMAIYMISALEDASRKALKEFDKAIDDFTRGDEWKNIRDEQQRDDDNWLRRHLGDS
jgi:hypothetical protein